MDSQTIIARINSLLPDVAHTAIEGADCSFSTLVVSDAFEGMSPVKRQQTILAGFAGELGSGELHALSVKAYTPAEWEATKGASLTQLSL